MADFRARAGKIQDKPETSECVKQIKKCSSNEGDVSKACRGQLETLALTQLGKFKQQYKSCQQQKIIHSNPLNKTGNSGSMRL